MATSLSKADIGNLLRDGIRRVDRARDSKTPGMRADEYLRSTRNVCRRISSSG